MADMSIFEWIAPMKCAVGHPGNEEGWAAELKWDGLRCAAATDGTDVQLRSSTGRDFTAGFPELANLGRQLGAPAVLDGELVVFDQDRPTFVKVLERLNVAEPSQSLLEQNPVVFIAFDLLALGDKRLDQLPYSTRRRVLADLVDDSANIRVPPHVEQGSSQLLTLARDRQLEGVVVKRLDSVYASGSRSNNWRKIKVRLRQEFVVGGWLPGQGSLTNDIGSLILGVWDGPDLVMTARAGSGLKDEDRQQLRAIFQPRSTPPFSIVEPLDRVPQWIEPTVVVEAEFSEWPLNGHLRHPVFVALRTDVDPTDVTREIPPPGSSA